MIAPARGKRRQDNSHSVPTPTQIRRRQRRVRESWNEADSRQRSSTGPMGEPQLDAMLEFLKMLARQ